MADSNYQQDLKRKKILENENRFGKMSFQEILQKIFKNIVVLKGGLLLAIQFFHFTFFKWFCQMDVPVHYAIGRLANPFENTFPINTFGYCQ